MLKFSAGLLRAGFEGQNSAADRAELVRDADNIAALGAGLLPFAPADIKDDMSTVLKAAAEASRHLNPSDRIAAAVEPMNRPKTVAAKDELERYAGPGGACG